MSKTWPFPSFPTKISRGNEQLVGGWIGPWKTFVLPQVDPLDFRSRLTVFECVAGCKVSPLFLPSHHFVKKIQDFSWAMGATPLILAVQAAGSLCFYGKSWPVQLMG